MMLSVVVVVVDVVATNVAVGKVCVVEDDQ